MNPVHRLHELGQSVWLDFLDHELITSGELTRLITHEGVVGLTSNPTIFEKSIAKSRAYDDLIRNARDDESDANVFENIEVREVALACDAFWPVYDTTHGRDGFVSIEVSPTLARDTQGTITEARRLWKRIDRPNVMVKIPGTVEGVPAIEQCLAAGININITLLFSVERYVDVAEAYVRALGARRASGQPLDRIASVASFFVSRVDTKVDAALDRVKAPSYAHGRAAICNAKRAYAEYERRFAGPRWEELAANGARTQRLLWASTSTKNPAYRDLHYVEALVGKDTVDTMTKETLRALMEHGSPAPRLAEACEWANKHIVDLQTHGLDLDKMLQELEDEGVAAFAKSYDKACEVIARKRTREHDDFANEATAKRTEFGDKKSARAMAGRGLKQVP